MITSATPNVRTWWESHNREWSNALLPAQLYVEEQNLRLQKQLSEQRELEEDSQANRDRQENVHPSLRLGWIGTSEYSTSAEFIRERIRNSFFELQKPEFYFSVFKKVLPELNQIRFETAESGWDGYDASPVLPETFNRAVGFLASLPNFISAPSVGAEPDGHLTFQWRRSPQRVLSVSISPEGDLHYAALIGPNKAYGTELFFGESPKVILDLIQRVNAS